MAIKLLSFQMIPRCFHLTAGNHHADPSSTTKAATATGPDGRSSSPGSIQLIRTDGKVVVYHRPVTASELMTEHPRHLVCRSDAPFTIGQIIPSLPEGEQLQPGQAYFLLPVHVFPSLLSFVNLAASFARAAARGGGGALPPALLQKPPFDVQKAPNGKLQVRVSEAFIERIRVAQDGGGGGGRVCTTAALEKEYRQLVSARQWKPRLATIRESAEAGKGRLFAVAVTVALGGIRWRRKANQGQRRRPEEQLQKKM